MTQCAGIKRDGGRCAVVVGPGQSHCYAHDPDRSQERRRNASRGGKSKSSGGELLDLKRQLKDLAAGVLDGSVDRGAAAVRGVAVGLVPVAGPLPDVDRAQQPWRTSSLTPSFEWSSSNARSEKPRSLPRVWRPSKRS